MADNKTDSTCSYTDAQRLILDGIYIALSFVSFIVALISIIHNRYYHHLNKDKFLNQLDPNGQLLYFALIVCCIFELIETFWWVQILKNFVGCVIVGTARQYTLVSSLFTILCVEINLLFNIAPPKCLRVINEQKQKRLKLLVTLYICAIFVVPVIFVPWPAISTIYINHEYFCTFNTCTITGSALFLIAQRAFIWQMCELSVWLFGIFVLFYALYRYFVHQLSSSTTKVKFDLDMNAKIAIYFSYMIQSIASIIPEIWKTVQKQVSFPLDLLQVIVVPCTFMAYSIILFVRQEMVMRKGLKRIGHRDKSSSEKQSIVTFAKSYVYLEASETMFKPAHDE